MKLSLTTLTLWLVGGSLVHGHYSSQRRDGMSLAYTGDNPDKNLLAVGSRYTTNVTIDGFNYSVLIDTGSNDLWVKPTEQHLARMNSTNIPVTVQYSANISGVIGVGAVEVGSYKVSKQAFIAVKDEDVQVQGVFDLGLQGLLGLSIHSQNSSQIDKEIKRIYGDSASWGQSYIESVFAQDPSKSNYFAVSLSRTNDSEGTADSSFYISSVDSDYGSVNQAPKLDLFPKGIPAWWTLLDGVSVDGISIGLESVLKGKSTKDGQSVPDNKIFVGLDTGAPSLLLPQSVISGIYGKISGAQQYNDTWYVPCNASNIVYFSFGGQNFPVNPLDLTKVVESPASDGGSTYFCIADASSTESSVYHYQMDGLLGTPFLRNAYSLYNYGDTDSSGKPTRDPYIQLLSQTNATEAATDVSSIREKTAPSARRGSFDDFVKVYPEQVQDPSEPSSPDESNEPSSQSASSGPSSHGASSSQSSQGDSSGPSSHGASEESSMGASKSGASGSSGVSGSLSNDDAESSSPMSGQFARIVIGLLAGNLVIGLVLVLFSIAFFIRRGTPKGPARYTPVSLKDAEYHD